MVFMQEKDFLVGMKQYYGSLKVRITHLIWTLLECHRNTLIKNILRVSIKVNTLATL